MGLPILFRGTSGAIFTYVGSGGLMVAGTAPLAVVRVPGVSGGLTTSGVAAVAVVFVPAAAGGVTTGGAGIVSVAKVFVPAGGVVTGGVAVTVFVSSGATFVYVGSGGGLLGGAADAVFEPAFIPPPPRDPNPVWATSDGLLTPGTPFKKPVVDPVPAAWAFAGEGGVAVSGAAIAAFTESPAARQMEELMVMALTAL